MEIPESKEIRVSAKGSLGGPYTVTFTSTFTLRGEEFSIRCSCKAGQSGQSCEHVNGLVLGDDKILADPADKKKLGEIGEMVRKSNLSPALNELNLELEKIEKAMEELRRRKEAVRIKIARAITTALTRSGG